MDELVQKAKTDPRLESAEQEFSVSFTKDDEKAWIHSTIASQVKRLLSHSDAEVESLSTYNEDTDTYATKQPEEVEENEIIWGFSGTIPIESLKINSSPRSQRSYANVISTQVDVNINEDD